MANRNVNLRLESSLNAGVALTSGHVKVWRQGTPGQPGVIGEVYMTAPVYDGPILASIPIVFDDAQGTNLYVQVTDSNDVWAGWTTNTVLARGWQYTDLYKPAWMVNANAANVTKVLYGRVNTPTVTVKVQLWNSDGSAPLALAGVQGVLRIQNADGVVVETYTSVTDADGVLAWAVNRPANDQPGFVTVMRLTLTDLQERVWNSFDFHAVQLDFDGSNFYKLYLASYSPDVAWLDQRVGSRIALNEMQGNRHAIGTIPDTLAEAVDDRWMYVVPLDPQTEEQVAPYVNINGPDNTDGKFTIVGLGDGPYIFEINYHSKGYDFDGYWPYSNPSGADAWDTTKSEQFFFSEPVTDLGAFYASQTGKGKRTHPRKSTRLRHVGLSTKAAELLSGPGVPSIHDLQKAGLSTRQAKTWLKVLADSTAGLKLIGSANGLDQYAALVVAVNYQGELYTPGGPEVDLYLSSVDTPLTLSGVSGAAALDTAVDGQIYVAVAAVSPGHDGSQSNGGWRVLPPADRLRTLLRGGFNRAQAKVLLDPSFT